MPIYLIAFFIIHFALALIVIKLLLGNEKLAANDVRRYILIALLIPIAGPVVGFAFHHGIVAGPLRDKGGISDGSNTSNSSFGDGGD
ncbi:hypothetical protein [Aliiglaciecola sp. M165]|uniref:hypothetical protein n=1 Tax=Aliiglaciecola sp. M165 TaxID=2593649 RepID=UPI00117DB705|nr:hypothetical protein [Aliiglaciecola sp. M165]TRY28679.1 hypothetical protein FM019_20680 [Aliiglaciecola sp. M165]